MNKSLILLAGALFGALAGCGQSEVETTAGRDDPGLPPGPVSCPAGGDLSTAADLAPGLLPDEQTLKAWQEFMVGQGPRFTGSLALKNWHNFLANKLTLAGLDVKREPMPIAWWHHKKWSLKLIENGVETDVPVASYYPYSGFTPEGGIVADVADAGMGTPAELLQTSGKIAFYKEDMLPMKMALFFSLMTYYNDLNRTMLPTDDYKRASISFLTPQESTGTTQDGNSLSNAKSLGAVGVIVSYDASAENAAGQYTPFLTSPSTSQGIPALYVDRATGDMIAAKIKNGVKARLELVVDQFPDDTTDDIVATLPGMTDEVTIVNTHTDGTSSAEENGGIGVVALAQYFAALPRTCRQRTMVFTLNPGHFNNGIGGETARFIKNHPEIISKAVASVTIEHLGQTEWVDDTTGFHATGLVEPGLLFGSGNDVQLIMANAVREENLDRAFVMRPIGVIYFGVGSPLNAAGVPNAAYITGPNSMLSWAHNQHLDKVDYARMAAEIRTMTRVAANMDATDKATLCAGMWSQSPQSETGCTPVPPAP